MGGTAGDARGVARAVPEASLVEAACATADVHPLLCAVAQVTGDLSLLREDLAPDQEQLLVPGRGLAPEQEDEARAAGRGRPAGPPGVRGTGPRAHVSEDVGSVFGFLVGAGSTEQWEGFLTEELALPGSDPRAPSWRVPTEIGRSFRCAVIGAGASGLAAAHRLRQAGVEVTVFEKNGDVGGTWLENVYPGCRVDVPNQLYSFSFAQTNDWASRFSAQPDLLAYLQTMTKELELGECIRFGTEVTEARFDDGSQVWTLTLRAGDGRRQTERTETFDGVVCAVGQLNRPSFRPSRAGTVSPARPSTRRPGTTASSWPAGGSPSSGPGPSAAQFVPCLVDEVAHLDVYQRTPPWLLPTDNYGDPFPPAFHDLLAAAADLRTLGPAVAVLAHARGAARGRPGRPRVGRAHRGGERGQRLRALHAARRPAGPGRRRRALREDGPALPALRQAGPARRRAVGGRPGPARRRPDHDADRRRSRRTACAPPTAWSTRRTC